MKDLKENFIDDKGKVNFNDYFGDDSLVSDIYDDVKDHYMKKNSRQTFNQTTNSAELVLPNIYKTNFHTGSDGISYIKSKGENYFKDILELDYAEDNNPYDVKLVTLDDKTIYVKFVHQLPIEPENPNILQEDERNGEPVQYRLDEQGNYMYMKPPKSSVLVKNGVDVVYIRISKDEDSNVLKKGISYDFTKFIE